MGIRSFLRIADSYCPGATLMIPTRWPLARQIETIGSVMKPRPTPYSTCGPMLVLPK